MASTFEKPQDEQETLQGHTNNVKTTEHIRTSETGRLDDRGDRLGIRLLRVLVLVGIYFVLEILIKALTVVQFIFVAWQKRPHPGMQRLGMMISEYICTMWKYCTFASDEAPWPFKPRHSNTT